MNLEAARSGHFFHAGERFEGAEQNASGLAFRFAGDVETVVGAVDEIDVGVAGWSEQDGSAGGVAGGGVGGGIVLAEVGFDFDDAGGERGFSAFTNQHLAQEFASDAARIAAVKGARQGMDLRGDGRSLRLRHAEGILNARGRGCRLGGREPGADSVVVGLYREVEMGRRGRANPHPSTSSGQAFSQKREKWGTHFVR